MAPTSSELEILHWLGARDHAAALAIGSACDMTPAEVRSRLAKMESLRLVSSRQDKTTTQPRRVYFVTGEGRRAAGIVDLRAQDA